MNTLNDDYKQILTELTERQIKTIACILEAPSVSEGCRLAQISRDSFYTWMRIPLFKNEYDRLRRERTNEALSSLIAGASKAVDTLRELLDAEAEGVRLRAAQTMIENTVRLTESEEIGRRLCDIEKRLGY